VSIHPDAPGVLARPVPPVRPRGVAPRVPLQVRGPHLQEHPRRGVVAEARQDVHPRPRLVPRHKQGHLPMPCHNNRQRSPVSHVSGRWVNPPLKRRNHPPHSLACASGFGLALACAARSVGPRLRFGVRFGACLRCAFCWPSLALRGSVWRLLALRVLLTLACASGSLCLGRPPGTRPGRLGSAPQNALTERTQSRPASRGGAFRARHPAAPRLLGSSAPRLLGSSAPRPHGPTTPPTALHPARPLRRRCVSQ
jgi:hypothetical protein